MALALTLVALAVLTWVPARPVDPGMRLPRGLKVLTFPVGNMAELARFMAWLRLGWLLLAPGGRPLRPVRRLMGLLRIEVDLPDVPDLAPWRSLSLRHDGLIALGLLGIAIAIRWLGMLGLNPDGMPFGSDWHSFMQNTRAVMSGDWTLYNPDKLPLHALLAAMVAPWVGKDPARAGQVISWISMTLSAPVLYLALRLALGRASAVGGTLLFALSGMMQYLANANTSYGLFTGLTVLAVGSAAGAAFTGRLWTYGLLGVAIGLGLITEVKMLTVAAPLLAALAIAWVLPGRSWKERLLGPVLLIVPIVALSSMLSLAPVNYTPLDRKLEIQNQEVVRFMAEQPGGGHPGLTTPDGLPPLKQRIAFNLARAKALALFQWRALLLLALAGLVAPLVARGRVPLRSRLAGLSGPFLLAGVIGSAAGAIVLLFMVKYVVPVVPFFLALVVHGGWCVASWMAPAGSPRLLRNVMGWAVVATLGFMVLPLHEIRDLPALQPRAVATHLRQAMEDGDIQNARAAWVTANWIEGQVDATTALWMCDRSQVAVFLTPSRRLYPLHAPTRNPIELCREAALESTWSPRLWVVDDRGTADLVQQMNQDALRFKRLLRVPMSGTNDPRAIWVFREGSPGLAGVQIGQ